MADDLEGLDYWTRWQVPVCGLITVAPAIAAAIVVSRSKEEKRLRPSDLWVPCFKNLSPFWLLGYRAIVAVFMSFVLFRMVVFDGASAFYFYTQWTFTLVIIYFGIGTVISAYGCWINSEQVVTEDEEANGFLRREFQANVHATLTFTDKSAVSWQSHKVKEMNDMSAGKWGYAMQVIYQVL